jgi:tRNA-dihydrouridine synthase
MTRVEGLIRNNKPTLAKIRVCDSTPVEVQLLASNDEQLEKYLSSFTPFDGFKGFNLNLSCPSREIMQVGRGAAMVKRLSKVQKLVSIFTKHNFPVSLKLRLGMNEYEQNYKVYLKLIQGVDAEYYIVHAKHGMQTSQEDTNYSILPECIDAAKSKGREVIANGGIDSREKVDLLKKMGAGGVMIGRAAMNNPSIFDLLKGKKFPTREVIKAEYLALVEKYNSPEKYKENLLALWR